MGYIIRNGIKYFGDNAVEITQAQYDALPLSKLTDGVDYYITDAQAGTPLATEIAMSTSDNTSVKANIDSISSKLNGLHIRNAYFSSSSPLVLSTPSHASYGIYLIFGFFQGIGPVLLEVTISANALSKIYNLRENSEFSSTYFSFSYSPSIGLTVTSTLSSLSSCMILYS